MSHSGASHHVLFCHREERSDVAIHLELQLDSIVAVLLAMTRTVE